VTIERLALATLAVLTALSAYTLVVAADRFGNAARTFDTVEFELESFAYERDSDTAEIALRVSNNGRNDALVVYIEYAFVISGVLAGGGDARPAEIVEPGGSRVFQLQGRISDRTYVDRQDPNRPLSWLVNARMQVNVDERLDSVFIPFSFRTETP
jgi:hypothetical protein